MSILSDRRSLREIGGFRAYLTQVGWSIWWRARTTSERPSAERSGAAILPTPAEPGAVAAHLRSGEAPPPSA